MAVTQHPELTLVKLADGATGRICTTEEVVEIQCRLR